jgi:hypothetical protein
MTTILNNDQPVTSETELNQAIEAADTATAAGNYEIEIGGQINLLAALEAINLHSDVSLTISGGSGGALDGESSQRGLFIYSGDVTIDNLSIVDAVAVGGAGGGGGNSSLGGGGGGGAGLGGGLFVAGATTRGGAGATSDPDQAVVPVVTLDNVSFSDDSAEGGNGSGSSGEYGGGGGGGGLGGPGGGGSFGGGGGGGIGTAASGGAGAENINGGHAGIVAGTSGRGGSAAGSGGASGGGGGGGAISAGGGGGGGIGGGGGAVEGNPGAGGFGGGGGAGSPFGDNRGGAGGFGGGGGYGYDPGGNGGFGGGGGGGGSSVVHGTGGPRGGAAGFGAGSGARSTGGGGGLGAGGDIFVQQGATLTIEGGTLDNGTVTAGQGAGGGAAGQAYGSGIFIQGDQSVTFGTGQTAGQTTRVNGVITDQTGSDTTDIYNDPGAGSVIVAGTGTVVLGADNTYTGGTTIQSGTLELGAAHAAGSGAIKFDPGTLEFTSATAPTNPIENFGAGDTIQIDDFTEQSGTYFNNTLTLHGTNGSGGVIVTLDVPGLAPSNFAVNVADDTTTISYGTGESDIVPCYCPGTLIRTKRGQKKVEKLKIGDEVLTASGAARPIKWIGRRSYLGRFVMGRKDILPVSIKAGALDDNVPKRDLWISPNHALYLDGMLIEAKDLINGASIVQAQSVETVEYIHIELDTHDVIIAEGALAESYIDDDNRLLFQNAHEYREQYPQVAIGPARYCAPRCDEGYEVEAVRRRIALRAGLTVVASQKSAGALRGYIERITNESIAGWAQNVDHPEAPVCLDIFAGGQRIGQALANCYRHDLKRAGMGSGHHGFAFAPPDGLAFAPDAVEVRRSLDGAALELSHGARRAVGERREVKVKVWRKRVA